MPTRAADRSRALVAPAKKARWARTGLFVVAAAVVLAACGAASHRAAADPDNARVASGVVPTRAPRWQGAAEIVPTGTSTGWIIAPDPASISTAGSDPNHRPLWILYRVSSSRAVDVTPGGITTRGGIVASIPTPGTIWVGIGSYKEQLDGAVGVSTDGGRDWTMEVLPALFDPSPDGLVAASATRAWALAGQGVSQKLLETATAGATWRPVASRSVLGAAASRCQLSGVGLTGSTIWLGTTCTSGPPVVVAGSTFGARWSVMRIGSGTDPTAAAASVGSVDTAPPGTPGTGNDATVATRNRTGASLAVATFSPQSTTPTVTSTLALPAATTAQVAVGDGEDAALLQPGRDNATGGRETGVVETSEQGGPSWSTPSGTGLTGTTDGIGVAGQDVLWVVGSTGGSPALWESTTGGASWTAVHLVAPHTSASLPGAGS